jgi:hypothetical protein
MLIPGKHTPINSYTHGGRGSAHVYMRNMRPITTRGKLIYETGDQKRSKGECSLCV